MKNNWKCRLGFHDWERITNKARVSRDDDGLAPYVYDQLCIRAGCRKLKLKATKSRTASANAKADAEDRESIANEKAKLHIEEG